MKIDVRTGVLAAVYVSAVVAVTTLSHLPAFAMTFASSSILLGGATAGSAALRKSWIDRLFYSTGSIVTKRVFQSRRCCANGWRRG